MWLLYGVHLLMHTASEQRRAVDYSFLQRDETLDMDESKSTIEAGTHLNVYSGKLDT